KEIRDMDDFVQRNIDRGSTTKRAQSRRKQLESMTKLDSPLVEETSANFSFDVNRSRGNDVVHVEDISYTHEGVVKQLFSNNNFMIHCGERIALIGNNGVSKTTLLKAILHDQPGIRHGSNVQIGYYAQEQEKLTPANTVLDEVWDDFPDKTEQA